MKTLYKPALSLGLAAIGIFGLQGSAMALTSINANICQIANAFPNGQVFRQANAISVVPGVGQQLVYCPIVRVGAAPSSGYTVYIDGSKAAGGSSFDCSLQSFDIDNRFLGMTSMSVSSTGTFSKHVTLPAAQVPQFSHQVLACLLPADSSLFAVQSLTP